MSSLAKTNALPVISSVEIKNTLPAKPAYYIPVKTKLKVAEEPSDIPSSSKLEIPIDKWTMPVLPQGYLSAKRHDIF